MRSQSRHFCVPTPQPCSYSQHGAIFSGLFSCSLGYVHDFWLLFLHWFLLNLVVLRVDFTVFWV
jgi:NADH-ubiquinone oxidoreductase chain 4